MGQGWSFLDQSSDSAVRKEGEGLNPYHCRSGDNCTAKTSDGPAIITKRDAICPSCVVAIQRQADELPWLAYALKAFVGGSMKVAYTSKVSRTAEPQAPMNAWVVDLIDEIGDALDRTDALDIRDLVLRPAELFIVWAKNVQQKRYLSGIDRALDIRRVHAKVAAIVGLHPAWEYRALPCPDCRGRLANLSGSDEIVCVDEDCGFTSTREEYDQACILLASEEKKRK